MSKISKVGTVWVVWADYQIHPEGVELFQKDDFPKILDFLTKGPELLFFKSHGGLHNM